MYPPPYLLFKKSPQPHHKYRCRKHYAPYRKRTVHSFNSSFYSSVYFAYFVQEPLSGIMFCANKSAAVLPDATASTTVDPPVLQSPA